MGHRPLSSGGCNFEIPKGYNRPNEAQQEAWEGGCRGQETLSVRADTQRLLALHLTGLAGLPLRCRRPRRAAPTVTNLPSRAWCSSAARAASKPRIAELHARTQGGSVTRRSARRLSLNKKYLSKSTLRLLLRTGGRFLSWRGAWRS